MAWDNKDNIKGKMRWTKRVTGATDIDETLTFTHVTLITDIIIVGPTTSTWSSTYKPTSSSTGQQLSEIALDASTPDLYSNHRFVMYPGESLNIASALGVSGEKELTIKALNIEHPDNKGAAI